MRKLAPVLSRGALAALALVHLTCHQAILTAAPGATLTLIVNPNFIPAHSGVSVVSALVMEEIGTPVPDGTVVQFFTSLGRIDEQGKTNDGVARVNLLADSRLGTAHITAFSGAASDSEDVTIGPVPARVIVTADPPFIPSNSRTTHIFANVLDADGNPVQNIPVIFQVLSPATGVEFMESGGNPIFTDTNGRAEDILRTRRPFGTVGPPAVVGVLVLAGGNIPTNPPPSVSVPIQ